MGVVYFLSGIVVGCLIIIVQVWGWSSEQQIGMNWEEINKGIELCEIDLPRYKNCKVDVRFVEDTK